MNYGATPDEWAHFDVLLGLGEDLLPTVCDPSVERSPLSKVQHGRTPSRINRDGQMAGIPKWTQIKANGEIRQWSRDIRYGICIQTRHLRGIDIDVPDPVLAQRIADRVAEILGLKLPCRRRENTGKRLLAVIVKGEIPKRSIKLGGTDQIEFLGNGQMFVAAGARTDGSRYYWEDGLPDTIPEITREQYDALVAQLAEEFAVEPVREASSSARQRGEHLGLEDPVADWLYDQGLVLSETRSGALAIACPWSHEHTSGEDGDSSTVWFPAGTNGYAAGHFKCMHGHCEGRNRSDFLAAAGYREDVSADFEDLGPDPDAPETSEDDFREAPATKFQLIQAADFAAQPSGAWLVKGLIPKEELVIVYGASGAGKSFVMIDLCMAIARGIDWRGCRVKQGKIIYIAAEGGGGVRKRLKAYAQHHQVSLGNIPFYVLHASPNLLDKAQVKLLIAAIEAAGDVAMIVCDTFAQMTPGANENAAEDMGLAISHIRAVGRRSGATTVLVHHAGKDATKGARGWSGLKAAADAEVEVTRDGDARSINTTKQKDADDGASWPFKLEVVPIGMDDDGDVIESCVIVESDVHVEAGVRGGGRAGASKAKFGPWEQAVLDTYAELAVGGDVLKSELVITTADKMDKPESVKIRRATALRALKKLCDRGAKKRFAMVEDFVIEETN